MSIENFLGAIAALAYALVRFSLGFSRRYDPSEAKLATRFASERPWRHGTSALGRLNRLTPTTSEYIHSKGIENYVFRIR